MFKARFAVLFAIVVTINGSPIEMQQQRPQGTSEVQCSEEKACSGAEQKCVAGICVTIEPKEICPANMHHVQCGTACPERCNKTHPAHCIKMCVAGCVCDEGFMLHDDGSCVDRALCSATLHEMTGEAELNDACTVICPSGTICIRGPCTSTCTVGTLEAGCSVNSEPNDLGCAKLECNNRDMVLPPGWRWRAGLNETCANGMVFSPCTPLCPEKNCDNLNFPSPCFSLRCGAPGCRCVDGLVYSSLDRSEGCVTREVCAERAAEAKKLRKRELEPRRPERCAAEEEFTNCGTACEPTCDNPNPTICTKQCLVNVCQCKTDYARNAGGQCIRKENCPKF